MKYILLAFSLLVVLTGCNKSESPEPSNTAGTPTPAAPAAPAAAETSKAPDACTAVSVEEMSRILGEPVTAKKEDMPSSPSGNIKVSQCTFSSANGMKSFGILIRDSGANDNDPNYVKHTMEQSGMKTEDVPGIGDSAFWASPQLIAFRGKNIQLVISSFGFDQAKEKSIEVARAVLK